MKFFLLFFVMAICHKSICQVKEPNFGKVNSYAKSITAKEAYKYVGEMVVVHDSIFSGKIYKDSIAVCQVGEKKVTPRLTMIYINTSHNPLDSRFIHTFQSGKLWLKGIVLGTQNNPLIIMYGLENLKPDIHMK